MMIARRLIRLLERSLSNALVRIVDDGGRLRAQGPDGMWVRFPKKLRTEGAVYEVGMLKQGPHGKSWMSGGGIKRIK